MNDDTPFSWRGKKAGRLRDSGACRAVQKWACSAPTAAGAEVQIFQYSGPGLPQLPRFGAWEGNFPGLTAPCRGGGQHSRVHFRSGWDESER